MYSGMQTTTPAPNNPQTKIPQITPLALAALKNGVAFDDVSAYLGRSDQSGLVNLLAESIACDYNLNVALERSHAALLAQNPARNLEAARLWWRGVL